MPYTALPDRRISYDNDGTVWAHSAENTDFVNGIAGYLTQAQAIEHNDDDRVDPSGGWTLSNRNAPKCGWLFFPEVRAVTGVVMGFIYYGGNAPSLITFQGSSDTTNGVDGTWETASIPGGSPIYSDLSIDGWRKSIKAVSFTGGKRTIRWKWTTTGGDGGGGSFYLVHLYGQKSSGQSPDDIVFIDHDTTPGIEYTAPEDFGDRPLGTTSVRQFRIKNTSASLTANTIAIQCNDTDFAISTDNVTWVVTINIGSLAAGAQSATMYIRNTTPGAGNLLGPRFARIVATVGSWS